MKILLQFIYVVSFSIPVLAYGEGTHEFLVGLMAEMTGPSANIGLDCIKGYEIAKQVYEDSENSNSYKIIYHFADHKADSKIGVTEFNRLVDVEGVFAVVTNRSSVALAINPISKRKRIPILVITGQERLRSNNPYAFEYWPLVADESQALAKKLIELGKKKIALLSTEDDWTLALRDRFKEKYQGYGGRVKFDKTITSNEMDVTTYLTQIKNIDPDALFVNLRPGQIGLAVRKARELKINSLIVGNFYMRKHDEIVAAGEENIQGAMLVEPDFSQPRFVDLAYNVLGDDKLTGVTYTCFSALRAIHLALRRNSNISSPADLYRELEKIKYLELPDEKVQMIDRAARYNLVYKSIDDGQVVSAKGQ